MPKIITREYDNSKLVSTINTSFAVVVPGLVENGRGYRADGSSVFDSNGVYFCNSKSDFEKYIGLIPGKQTEAIGPELYVFETEDGVKKVTKTLSAEEFYVTYRNHDTEVSQVYTRDPDSGSNKVGYLHDDKYVYTLATDWNPKLEYCVILTGNEGRNAKTDDQNGNQIAYLLLDLGYEVLYKKYTTVSELDSPTFWEPLKDQSMYRYRYLISGGYNTTTCANCMAAIASFDNSVSINTAQTLDDLNGRGDIIALIDILEDHFITETTEAGVATGITNYINKVSKADKNSAFFAPYVVYNLDLDLTEAFDKNSTFPASVHYLACAAYAQSRFAEWYATAGYDRGICKYEVLGTTYAFGERLINTLAPRVYNKNYGGINKACNLILNERGRYYLWGNRTAEKLNETELKFSHYLNIRQLCTTIKQYARDVCRTLTFDPNSDILWLAFVNGMTPILERMKADQGIDAYKITKVKTAKKGLVTAKIRIVPVEAAEDFDINLYLEDSLAGITVNSDEVE